MAKLWLFVHLYPFKIPNIKGSTIFKSLVQLSRGSNCWQTRFRADAPTIEPPSLVNPVNMAAKAKPVDKQTDDKTAWKVKGNGDQHELEFWFRLNCGWKFTLSNKTNKSTIQWYFFMSTSIIWCVPAPSRVWVTVEKEWIKYYYFHI